MTIPIGQTPDQTDAAAHRRTMRAMFDRIARRYDLMNDLMSGGIHRLWKRRLRRLAGPPPSVDARALDLAGGTGDVARLLAEKGWQVTVCDPSAGMMEVGRTRTPEGLPIDWVSGSAEALPFNDQSFDLLTISFGFRNVTDRALALRNMRRVLKPGGRLLILEFSTPHRLIRGSYDLYSAHGIPLLARVFSRDAEAYGYLTRSIRAFPDQAALATMMGAAGFEDVTWETLFFGIAAVHQGLRLPSSSTGESGP